MPDTDPLEDSTLSSDLRFPQLQPRYDLSDLIAHSNTPRDSNSRSPSSIMARAKSSIPLGESSYDFVSENGNSSHGEEVDTDDNFGSVASIDDHALDELESLNGTEISNGSRFSRDEDEVEEAAQAIPSFIGLDAASNSGMTVTNGVASSPAIEFTEQLTDNNYVAVTHTIRQFSEMEASDILNTQPNSKTSDWLTATLRQTMTRGEVAVDGPFKVLYVGDKAGKHDIVPKIGSALAAPISGLQESKIHYSSSRFSVVPISQFGSKRSPKVELIDSFGIELIVDDCTAAKTVRVRNSSDTLMLQLNNSIWISSHPSEHGHGFKIQPDDVWDLPQLAVFYIADDDSTENQKLRHYAKAFLARHHVPSINICESPDYQISSESMVLNPDSIHVCLQSRHETRPSYKVHTRLPVDLATFLSLDSHQMNRNFAFLTRSTVKSSTQRDRLMKADKCAEKRLPTFADVGRYLRLPRDIRVSDKMVRYTSIMMSLGLILMIVGGVYFKSVYFDKPELQWKTHPASSQGTLSSTSPGGFPISIGAGSRQTGSIKKDGTKPTSSLKASETRALSGPMADIASMILESGSAFVNHSDKFALHVIGDSHMILKPPHRFSQMKKPPKIFVKADRGSTSLQAKLSKLFDGVWTIELEREEAYGFVNISVWTKSKLAVRQNFEIDLGTPWLKLVSWQKAAAKLSTAIREDVRYPNGRLFTAIGEVASDPRTLLAQASSQAKSAGDILRRTSLSPVGHTKALVSVGASQIKKQFKAGQKALKVDLVPYASDLATVITKQATQGYRSATSFPLRDLWQNLHPVRPANVWTEARRHLRLIRNGEAYSKMTGKERSRKNRKLKKAGKIRCKLRM
ncbi:MAG: hypothetical protein M1814_003111 [Vezdaea aestivalis]|nr:MAG: hypothetical protein M1814_003111 [Vezdaea aestivalis]